MGDWGLDPWANDMAADWFGGLMDATPLRQRWREGITAVGDVGEVRLAAAWLFVQLGRIYVWPGEDFYDDLEQTITTLLELRSDERCSEGDPDGWLTMINGYITQLESRRRGKPIANRMAQFADVPDELGRSTGLPEVRGWRVDQGVSPSGISAVPALPRRA